MARLRLFPGMLIRTDYSGPYRIKKITRGCTCTHILAQINQFSEIPQPPHIHLELTRPDGTGEFWLNYYDEETLRSLDKSYAGRGRREPDYNWIEILPQDKPVQHTLF